MSVAQLNDSSVIVFVRSQIHNPFMCASQALLPCSLRGVSFNTDVSAGSGGPRGQRTLAAHSRRSREHPFRCMPVSPVDRNSCLRAFNHLSHLANCRLQPDCIDELGCAGDSWALPGLRRPGLVGLGAHLPRLYHRHPSLWQRCAPNTVGAIVSWLTCSTNWLQERSSS